MKGHILCYLSACVCRLCILSYLHALPSQFNISLCYHTNKAYLIINILLNGYVAITALLSTDIDSLRYSSLMGWLYFPLNLYMVFGTSPIRKWSIKLEETLPVIFV